VVKPRSARLSPRRVFFALVFAALPALGALLSACFPDFEVGVAGAYDAFLERDGAADVNVPSDHRVDVPSTMDEPVEDAVDDAIVDGSFDIANDVPLPSDCPDAATTLIYVITEDNLLYTFSPTTSTFTMIGTVNCPDAGIGSTFSMAVSREGIAYVLYQSSGLFKVDTKTAACGAIPYVPGQSGFTLFGMGFASSGASETLYVEADPYQAPDGATGLASIDTTSWKLTPIGGPKPPLAGGELTGTRSGGLFAFYYYPSDTTGSRLGQLDKTTGLLESTVYLSSPNIQGASFAMAFWGGSFYLFTDGTVTKYTPATGTDSVVATLDDEIVVAGVSTCAPE
jgi:hypothetical protein